MLPDIFLSFLSFSWNIGFIGIWGRSFFFLAARNVKPIMIGISMLMTKYKVTIVDFQDDLSSTWWLETKFDSTIAPKSTDTEKWQKRE